MTNTTKAQTIRTTFGRAWMADTSTERPRTYREYLGSTMIPEMRVEIAEDGTARIGGSLPGQMLSRVTLHDPEIVRNEHSLVVRDERYVIVMAEIHGLLTDAVADLGVAEFG